MAENIFLTLASTGDFWYNVGVFGRKVWRKVRQVSVEGRKVES